MVRARFFHLTLTSRWNFPVMNKVRLRHRAGKRVCTRWFVDVIVESTLLTSVWQYVTMAPYYVTCGRVQSCSGRCYKFLCINIVIYPSAIIMNETDLIDTYIRLKFLIGLYPIHLEYDSNICLCLSIFTEIKLSINRSKYDNHIPICFIISAARDYTFTEHCLVWKWQKKCRVLNRKKANHMHNADACIAMAMNRYDLKHTLQTTRRLLYI